MKKTTLFFLISVLFSFKLYSRDADRYKKALYNNSFVHVLYRSNDSLFGYKTNAVGSLLREKRLDSMDLMPLPYSSTTSSVGTCFQARTSGFAYLAEIGTTIFVAANAGGPDAVSLNHRAFFSFNQLLGGRTRPKLIFGWQSGIDYAKLYSAYDVLVFTTGMGLHAGLMNTRVEPTLDWDLGYALYYVNAEGFGTGIDHGMRVSLAPGIKVWVTRKVALNLRVGYKAIVLFTTNPIVVYHTVPIMLGVEF